MQLDWRSEELASGLACYRREEYFEAHEHWELLWRKADGVEKTLLHALIQIAVALCHCQRGNPVGAHSLFHKASERLDFCPDDCGGVNVAHLRKEVSVWLQYLEGGELGTLPKVPGVL